MTSVDISSGRVRGWTIAEDGAEINGVRLPQIRRECLVAKSFASQMQVNARLGRSKKICYV